MIYVSYNELYHHGIRGMKWGVRRFQKMDGSLTQEGVRRYKESEQGYDSFRKMYKSLSRADKKTSAGQSLKGSMKAYKKQMKEDYKQLKKDKLADKGYKLLTSGKNPFKGMGAATAAARLSNGSQLAQVGLGIAGHKKISDVSGHASLGLSIASAILSIPTANRMRKIKAYANHTRSNERLNAGNELGKAIGNHVGDQIISAYKKSNK